MIRAGNTHDGGFAAHEEGAVRSVGRLWSRAPGTPNEADADLLGALKALRGAIAAARSSRPMPFSPIGSLIEMAKERPRGLDELSGIHGVGSVKLQKYGSPFLAVIRDRMHA